VDKFSKNPQIPNFTKIRAVEAGLFHADRQTGEHDEVNNRLQTHVSVQTQWLDVEIDQQIIRGINYD
jgi:hypothetical protein